MGGACEECSRNCQLIHQNKMDLSPIVTRFVKVLVSKDFLQLLLLPRKFAATVMHLANKETKLEDSDGVQWTVTLSSFKDSLAFIRGWQEFSLNHNLQVGDFLVFNYIKGAGFVVQIFGRSCCESINSSKNGSPCKRARTRGNISAQGRPCERTDTNSINRHSSSTSAVSGSNLESSHIQPTTIKSAPSSEGGNGKWSILDSSFDMMIDRDAVPGPGEDRMCLYDLFSFEVQGGKQFADPKKGIDAVQGTSNHTKTIMNSQAEADKDPTGTENFNKATFTEENYIGMMLNDNYLESEDDMLLRCEEGPLADFSNSLPVGPSCAERGKKGDNMFNVNIQLQSAERNNGGIKKIMEKEQPDTREEANRCAEQPDIREEANRCAKKLRGWESSIVKESGSFSPGPYVCKPVKLEPVDSLDMPSSFSDTLTCLATMDDQHYLELPTKLPAITYRKGTLERKAVLLQDQDGRFWPALYCDRSGFHVLTSGWPKFNKEHRIQGRDCYIFQVDDVNQGMYKVDVLHQEEGTHPNSR